MERHLGWMKGRYFGATKMNEVDLHWLSDGLRKALGLVLSVR